MSDSSPVLRRPSGPQYVLPPDLLGDASRRLGLVAAAIAVLAALSIELTIVSGQTATVVETSFTVALLLLSMGVWALSRYSAWPPQRLLNLGLLYELLVCTALAVMEAGDLVPATRLLGTSYVSVMVVLFPIMVPASPTRTFAVALLATATWPLAYGLIPSWQVYQGGFTEGALVWLFSASPPAFLAFVESWVLCKLVCNINEARELGSYVLEEKLGQGGMGEVWRARHRLLSRPAAVKLIATSILAGGQDTRSTVSYFEREAAATAALRCPHSIVLYDYGLADDGTLFYVMELLDGLDLETLVERHGAVPPARCVHLLAQACLSLEEAHGRGMVHRDIKPANLFACTLGPQRDFLKVLDFGLVKVPRGSMDVKATDMGIIRGTPSYMAPEQAQGLDLDGRADLYALGCVGYWLLVGETVFAQGNPVLQLTDHIRTAPVPPSQRTLSPVPADLERVILDCLEKDPARRPPSARELRDRLLACDIQRWSDAEAEAWWHQRAAATSGPVPTPPVPLPTPRPGGGDVTIAPGDREGSP